MTTPKGKPPLRVKIVGDWGDAIGKSLRVTPPEKWPKPIPVPQRAKKTRKKK